ncbi:MAG TPA: HPP family protein [Terriglobales bacterium]|nr:HPP family protein [Terriglobales bacterium]
MEKSGKLAFEALGEGALLLAIGAIGWAAHQPLVFASLGPTAYEQVDQPHSKSSRPYNVLIGHLVGLGAGFLAVYIFNAWNEPKVLSTGTITAARLWAIVVSVLLTTLGTMLLKAKQPAATATTLLVALGSMQTTRDALAIIAGVVLITILGEPLRRVRARQKAPEKPEKSNEQVRLVA